MNGIVQWAAGFSCPWQAVLSLMGNSNSYPAHLLPKAWARLHLKVMSIYEYKCPLRDRETAKCQSYALSFVIVTCILNYLGALYS